MRSLSDFFWTPQGTTVATDAGLLNTLTAMCMLLVYTSVTPCVCTNSFLRERHGFGARAQGKIQEGTDKAQFRHKQGTFLAHFTTV